MTEVTTPPPAGTETDTEDDEVASVNETLEQAKVREANAEAKKYRLALREAQKALQAHADAGKSELERAQSTATTAEQRASAAETKALKYEIAAAHNIPLSQALRLQGADADALRQDAAAYAKELGLDGDTSQRPGSVRPGADTGAGARRPVPKPKGMNDMIFDAVRG